MLLCTVRSCRLPLTRGERVLRCPAGHSFDIARSGYLNLLQPQDRRSSEPGDSAEAVAARRRLHDRGVTAPLLQGLRAFCPPALDDVILDAGCGEGFYLGGLHHAHGIDISVAAIDAAARRYPESEWVVANADRFLPWSDASFTLLQSITGRMHPAEFRRVLQPSGRLLIALAAPDDFIELRGQGRDRTGRTIDEFSKEFRLEKRDRVTTAASLDREGIEDIRLAIYRPLTSQPAEAMTVTFSLDLLLFCPR